ncbi:MAG: 7-cyano-7-deazaguanine synthase QueC [Deltaproteobacteria bacterium]|nr:7-cyano-7-deazaguanine synthase QueC [Deltaproteobacteria bacterium]
MVHKSLRKSIVLLSGGLDSTVAFKKVCDETHVILAISFNYGQRSAEKEIEAAKRICRQFSVNHQAISLPWLRDITNTSLVDREKNVPQLRESELDNATGKAHESAQAVWVPNRNGIFINIAAAFCESMGAELLVTGFNAEEAETFPDNSPRFIGAINDSLHFSTLKDIEVVSPTLGFDKAGIVQLGIEIGAPLEKIWSCYEDGDRMCGKCESCMRLKRALSASASDLEKKLYQ